MTNESNSTRPATGNGDRVVERLDARHGRVAAIGTNYGSLHMGDVQHGAPREPTSTMHPRLVMSRARAAELLDEQIRRGRQIEYRVVEPSWGWSRAAPEWSRWHRFNLELLRRMFNNDSEREEYEREGDISNAPIEREEHIPVALVFKMDEQLSYLQSLRERLQLIPEDEPLRDGASRPAPVASAAAPLQRVFLIHGHDRLARLELEQFIGAEEGLNLQYVVLGDQPDEGLTIPEKLERYSDVVFAIALITPDDVGAASTNPDQLQPRARQNVILELGYFWAKLGRRNVRALYVPGVELPSDYLGVLWIPFDAEGEWKTTLARELRAAGIERRASESSPSDQPGSGR